MRKHRRLRYLASRLGGALGLAAALAGLAHAQAPAIALERLFSDPPVQGRLPRQAALSPGGAWVGFLRPAARDSEELELWAQPTAGGR